jgi:hypothetical protein
MQNCAPGTERAHRRKWILKVSERNKIYFNISDLCCLTYLASDGPCPAISDSGLTKGLAPKPLSCWFSFSSRMPTINLLSSLWRFLFYWTKSSYDWTTLCIIKSSCLPAYNCCAFTDLASSHTHIACGRCLAVSRWLIIGPMPRTTDVGITTWIGAAMLALGRGGNNHSPTRQMRVEFGIGE